MGTSKYGDWESRGEAADAAAYDVASRHQIHAAECLCGFSSDRARSRTEHIIDETLAALDRAGLLPQ